MHYSYFANTERSKAEKRPDAEISELLLELGIPLHYRGYQFLRDSLSLALEDEEYLFGVTKNLYPTIAKMHRSTAARVERSMRNAIEAAWSCPNGVLRQRLSGRETKPSNREFLTLLYKWISEERAENRKKFNT